MSDRTRLVDMLDRAGQLGDARVGVTEIVLTDEHEGVVVVFLFHADDSLREIKTHATGQLAPWLPVAAAVPEEVSP